MDPRSRPRATAVEVHSPARRKHKWTWTLLSLALMLAFATGAVLADTYAATQLVSGPLVAEPPHGFPSLGNGDSIFSSADPAGNLIVFDSQSRNLVQPYGEGFPEDPYPFEIYMFDRSDPEEPLIRLLTPGEHEKGSNESSRFPIISDVDIGSGIYYVVFQSRADNFDNFMPGEVDYNNQGGLVIQDIFMLRHPAGGEYIQLISRGFPLTDGAPKGANGHSGYIVGTIYPETRYQSGYRVRAGADIYRGGTGTYPFIVFESNATNLITLPPPWNQPACSGIIEYHPDANGKRDIFVTDNNNSVELPGYSEEYIPVTSLLSVNDAGEQSNGHSTHPVVSRDGRFVAFVSTATNLVADAETNGMPNIYMIDRDDDGDGHLFGEEEYDGDCNLVGNYSHKIYLVSYRSSNPGKAANDESWYPSIVHLPAQNKVMVAFDSLATNIIEDDTNEVMDIFLYTLDTATQSSTLERVSLSSGDPGDQADDHSMTPYLHPDGGVIAFKSYATNLVEGDNNYNCLRDFEERTVTNCADAFVRDLENRQTWRVSLTSEGEQAELNSELPRLVGDGGRYALYSTYADLRYEGEQTTKIQVFLRDQGNPAGNPNIQPSAGEFYSSVEEVAYITFNVSFLAPLELGQISLEYKGEQPDICKPENGDYCFRLVDENCSNTAFNQWDICQITVRWIAPDEGEYRARLRIPLINDDRFNLFVSLRGRAIVRYLPIILR
ncbi:MAG: hypothetical protein HPY76_03140 [Anaerolineae bacterium]|nr:hypothetical protein [Anaerolineae bacterium]